MSERGHLQVDVEGNASGFRQVLNSAKVHANQFSKEVGAGMSKSWGGIGKGIIGGFVGALSFEAVKSSLTGFLQKAQGLQDLSEQLNMGTDQTQKWAKAVDELGLSFGGLQSILATIEQARTDALTDPKSAEKFNALGISRADVLDTKGIGSSDFARMVLGAGGRDEASRAALADLAGKRATKFIGAAGEYGKATPDMDEQSIAMAKQSEKVVKKVGNWIDRLWSGILIGTSQFVKDAISNEKVSMFGTTDTSGNFSAAGLALTRGPRKKGTKAASSAVVDPLIAINEEARAKRDERRAAADERIADAQRQNMNTSEKKASLEKALAENRKRQDDLYARHAKGPPPNLKTEGEKGEWETKMYEDMASLKAKEQGIIGDMREKPIQLGADGLAKSGLFSASALNFSMSNDTERAQLDALRTIARLIQQRRDPHGL